MEHVLRGLPTGAERAAYLQVHTPSRGQGAAYADDARSEHASLEGATSHFERGLEPKWLHADKLKWNNSTVPQCE